MREWGVQHKTFGFFKNAQAAFASEASTSCRMLALCRSQLSHVFADS